MLIAVNNTKFKT